MKILLLLFLQSGVLNDLVDLRKFLGTDFAGAMKLLEPTNTTFIQNVQRSSPAQAVRMRAEMAVPASLGATQNIVPLVMTNAGRGLVTTLFEEDFITEKVNLVFCPAAPRRVVAVQVLFDERPGLRDTLFLLQRIYKMPKPAVFETYKPAMKYDLTGVTYTDELKWTRAASAPAVVVFDLGETAEVIYQPVTGGQGLVTAQLWVGDKKAAETCPVPIITKQQP